MWSFMHQVYIIQLTIIHYQVKCADAIPAVYKSWTAPVLCETVDNEIRWPVIIVGYSLLHDKLCSFRKNDATRSSVFCLLFYQTLVHNSCYTNTSPSVNDLKQYMIFVWGGVEQSLCYYISAIRTPENSSQFLLCPERYPPMKCHAPQKLTVILLKHKLKNTISILDTNSFGRTLMLILTVNDKFKRKMSKLFKIIQTAQRPIFIAANRLWKAPVAVWNVRWR